MKKNLLKPFLVTFLVIFCSVSVNAQRVEMVNLFRGTELQEV